MKNLLDKIFFRSNNLDLVSKKIKEITLIIPANQIFDVTVEAINDAPIIISSPIIDATEDILYQYQVEVLDPDDTEFNFTLYSYPEGMDVNESGLITWLPTEGILSSDIVIIQVSDGGENLASPDIQTFEINVQPINDSPMITSIPIISAIEDVEYLYQVIVSDPDDTEFTYQLLDFPLDMTINEIGLIQWIPTNGILSSDTVTVSVQDGGEDNSTIEFLITSRFGKDSRLYMRNKYRLAKHN